MVMAQDKPSWNGSAVIRVVLGARGGPVGVTQDGRGEKAPDDCEDFDTLLNLGLLDHEEPDDYVDIDYTAGDMDGVFGDVEDADGEDNEGYGDEYEAGWFYEAQGSSVGFDETSETGDSDDADDTDEAEDEDFDEYAYGLGFDDDLYADESLSDADFAGSQISRFGQTEEISLVGLTDAGPTDTGPEGQMGAGAGPTDQPGQSGQAGRQPREVYEYSATQLLAWRQQRLRAQEEARVQKKKEIRQEERRAKQAQRQLVLEEEARKRRIKAQEDKELYRIRVQQWTRLQKEWRRDKRPQPWPTFWQWLKSEEMLAQGQVVDMAQIKGVWQKGNRWPKKADSPAQPTA